MSGIIVGERVSAISESGYNFTLAAGAVHIWQIGLTLRPDEAERGRRLLSEDENQRADRFYFARDRTRFIAARAAMRTILSEYLKVAPQALVFDYTAKGKPELAGDWENSGIEFNLSHSRDFALLALIHDLRIGVDIEFINHECATDEIAAHFFSPREIHTLHTLPLGERGKAFFSCWTRKEAYIKALGEGLSLPLDSFDVAFGPGIPAALLRTEVSVHKPSQWGIYDVVAPHGYAAALAVEGNGHRLQYTRWESQL